MAVEGSLEGDAGRNEAITSRDNVEAENSSAMNADQQNSQKNKGDEKTKTVPFLKIFSFADSTDTALMIVGTIGAIGSGLGMPLMTILFGQLINTVGSNQNDNNDIVHAVSKETNTGEVVGRMSGDTVLIQDAVGEKVGKFLQLISTFIGGFIIAFIKGWLLTIVLCSAIPLLVIAGPILSLLMSKMASHGQTAYEKAANIVEQTIGAIKTVASFTGEKQAIASYSKFLAHAYKSGVHEGLAVGVGAGTVMLVVFSIYSFAVYFGAKLILQKGYNGGQVMNVIIAVLTSSMSLGQVSPCLSAFAAGRAAAYKMFETIERKPDMDAFDRSGKVLDDIRGDIELKDVYFSYPTRPDEQIFNGFSLYIPSGMTAALVGESGSGKSTVISLIERFYDPQVGEVLIDNINLKEFQLKWVRGKIGLVSQEPALFGASIKDNIAYGKDGATIEEIKAAAKIANAAKFIDKLPQGLNTIVGEHGTQMSGGQKQRIAIARAVLKDPQILLLDEATSALDAESENIVQEALDRIMVNRTTVVVAHRWSTVRNADIIAVIHRGKLVEKGSHSELLKDPDGAFSQLIRLQEVNKESQHAVDDQEKSEITLESLRQSSLRRSSRRVSIPHSISRGSSTNSSRHSFLVIFGVPRGLDVTNTAAAESYTPSVVPEKSPEVPICRLAYLNKPEIPLILIGTVGAIISGVVLPIFGLLISSVIKAFFEPPHELRKDSKFWATMFVVLGLVAFLSAPIRSYFFAVAGCKLIERIRAMCFEKVVRMEVGWFDEPENSSGAIGARLSADAAIVCTLVGDPLAQIVQSIATVIAGLVIAFDASWQMALIVLALVPLLGVNGYVQRRSMKGFSADAKEMYEDASQIATDAVGSIRIVSSFCAEEKVMQLYEEKCEGPMKAGIKEALISGIGYGMANFLLFNVYAIIFYAGAQLVKTGKATFSNVFRVFFTLTMAATAVTQSSSFSSDFQKAKNATASIFGIVDRKSKIDPSDESGMSLDDVKGDIELHHVSFNYPSRPDVQIFRDLNLAIRAGKTVALVGESGSGKSTMIALLERFYDPDSGHITLDGIEIQKFQLKWLRQQMGLVSQEPVLFNDTIHANIVYGKGGNADEGEIIAAAELANAHRFISGLQQGYDTVVGERGLQLSGGQKQRVAIARAIIKSPKILLLDEATSALDAQSEKLVQDALNKVMVNRTTFVVAHQLSTIKNADLIAVVKNGVIVEKGMHESLINIQNGCYASLVALHISASIT
ncbi:ABC transporter B family member 4-like isoform X2 [Corylus avellana]|uniref:ABC transporter B family member 4-like isoform X2 n=1 Tax=Corylus avellana TaxID=13451 RepID=UPI00286A129F|nr:ABC transporter B family member 4-like isoform X2 [Corylus avellana]